MSGRKTRPMRSSRSYLIMIGFINENAWVKVFF